MYLAGEGPPLLLTVIGHSPRWIWAWRSWGLRRLLIGPREPQHPNPAASRRREMAGQEVIDIEARRDAAMVFL
jgi:hypothetical protein